MRELTLGELDLVSGGDEETKVSEVVIVAQKNNSGNGDSGGFYFHFELALGIGVSLTISESGVDAGFLTGVAASVEVGHASSEKELVKAVVKDEQVVQAELWGVQVTGERDTKTGDVKVELEGGNVNVASDGSGGVMGVTTDGSNWSFGVGGAVGVETYLGHRDWYTPGDAQADSAQAAAAGSGSTATSQPATP